jgi:thiopurine S-methyltransferase
MEPEFWIKRWETGDIGFHRDEVNPALESYWRHIVGDDTGRVFVPLCGKSLDMRWLAERGHRVVGVELSEQAVDAFFAGEGLNSKVSQHGAFRIKSDGPFEIWCGDLFELPEAALEGVGSFYDRASVVALPLEMRGRYAGRLAELLPPGARGLLVTLTYDQSEMSGPPFSVSDAEVTRLFGGSFAIDELSRRDALSGNPNLVKRGLTKLTETCYMLRRFP